MKNTIVAKTLAVALLAPALFTNAFAASQTWSTTPADTNWANGLNWVGGAAAGALGVTNNAVNNDVATFNAPIYNGIGGSGNPIIPDSGPTPGYRARQLGSIVFTNASCGAYTFSNAGTVVVPDTGILFVSHNGNISIAPEVTNSQRIVVPLLVRLPSSTGGIYNFINNATDSNATLYIAAVTNNGADTRGTTFTLSGSNTGTNTIASLSQSPTFTTAVCGLNKTGSGTWMLPFSSFLRTTTPINILDGTLIVKDVASLGSATSATINGTGAKLRIDGVTLPQIFLMTNGTVQVNGNLTVNQVVVGTNTAGENVTLATTAPGDQMILSLLQGGMVDSTIHVAGPGTVLLTSTSTNLASWSVDSGGLQPGTATSLGSVPKGMSFGANSTGKWQLNGFDQLVTSLNCVATNGTPIVEDGAGVHTLTVSNALDNIFTGIIQDGGGSTLSLVKNAGGTLTLTGTNTYTGTTTVNLGKLKVDGKLGNTAVTVNGPATLAGMGSIGGSLTIGSGANLEPGGSVGVLTVPALTLANGFIGKFEFNATTNDLVIVTGSGSMSINGGSIYLYQEGGTTPFATAGTYRLFKYTGALGGTGTNGLTVANPQAGTGYSFSTNGGYVSVTLVAAGVSGRWNADLDGNWTDATKWTPGVPGIAGDSAIFGVGTSLRTVTLNANKSVGGMNFTNANSFVVTGTSTLTLNNSGSSGSISVNDGTANTISTPVALADNVIVAVGSGKSLAVGGVIANTSAAKAITANGAGTLVLNGNNTYGPAAGTIGTTISGGGTVQVGHNNALGAGDVNLAGSSTLKAGTAGLNIANNVAVAPGSTVTVDDSGNSFTLGGVVSSGGSLVKNGSGTTTLGSANSFGGSTTINGGTVKISIDSNLGTAPTSPSGNAIVLNGGTLLGDATFTLDPNRSLGMGPLTGVTGTNVGLDASTGMIFTVGGTLTTAGNTGVNSLTINGGAGHSGTVVLGGIGTFSGATVIANGTLQLANPLAIQGSSLNYTSSLPGTLTFDSAITSFAIGSFEGNKNLALTNLGGVGVAITNGGNNATTLYSGNLSDAGLTSGAGAFTKIGTGVLTLTGTNDMTGPARVFLGNLVISNNAVFNAASMNITTNSGLPRLTLASGSMTISGNCQVDSGAGGLFINSGVANVNGGLTTTLNRTAGNLISVTGGTLNASSITLGRTGLIYNTQPGAGDLNNGLVVTGGAVNVTGTLNVGGSSSGVNSSANCRMDSGSLTVSNAIIGAATGAGGRWSVLDINGGTFTCSDTNVGVTIGGSYLGSGLFLVRAGVASSPIISLGNATLGAVAGSNVLNVLGGSLYVGSGGIVQVSAATLPTISLNGGNLGALADWSTTNDIVLGAATVQASDLTNGAHTITFNSSLSGSTLTKTGSGALVLNGTNDIWTGVTTVSNGVLVLGTLAYPTNCYGFNVRSNAFLDASQLGFGADDGTGVITNGITSTLVLGPQVLSGSGTVQGSVVMTTNAILAPGDTTGGTGTLTVTNKLVLNGTLNFEVNHGLPNSADKIVTLGTFTNAGATLNVTTVGAAVQAGDSFVLFDRAVSNFAAVNLPVLSAPLSWTNKLAVNGSIAVVSGVSLTPVVVTNVPNGANLTLSWPTDHIGWRLVSHTNPALPMATWSTVAGSTTVSTINITINTNNPQVYYRLVYP